MGKIERFEDIELWQSSRELSSEVFKMAGNEAFSKDFRFRDQIKAASGSIMDNMAEGNERDGNKEFIQFLFIDKGSCGEVKSQIYRALDNKYITQTEFESLFSKADFISKGLANFINYLKNSEFKGTKYKS